MEDTQGLRFDSSGPGRLYFPPSARPSDHGDTLSSSVRQYYISRHTTIPSHDFGENSRRSTASCDCKYFEGFPYYSRSGLKTNSCGEICNLDYRRGANAPHLCPLAFFSPSRAVQLSISTVKSLVMAVKIV